MNNSKPADEYTEELRALFQLWPETAHIADMIDAVPFENLQGSADEGIESGSMIRAMHELLRVVRVMRSTGVRVPLELRELAARAEKVLPTFEAFHADPLTVMATGVN